MPTTQKQPSKARWDGGRKLTTEAGKPISDFTMKCFFYDSFVNMETAEVIQKQYTYLGWLYKRKLAKKNQPLHSQLDALLTWLKGIQQNCERVIIYDNSRSGFDEALDRPDAEILHLFEGAVIKGKNGQPVDKLRQYRQNGTITIPGYHFIKHAA